MAVRWDNPEETQAFRDSVIAQGADPLETDQYITSQKSSIKAPQEANAIVLPDAQKPVIPTAAPVAPPLPQMAASPLPKFDALPKPEAQALPPASFAPQTPETPTMNAQPMQAPSEPMQNPRQPMPQAAAQTAIIPVRAQVTQAFGNRNPRVEKYSGGVNLGTDFAVPSGTPLHAPQGEWKVVTAQPGFNDGSGNFVKIQNTKTGESIGYEHLTRIGVQPGQMVGNGVVVGLSGGNQSGPGRGNSTGAHASMPYQDAQGRYHDILKSPYAVMGGQ